ncbi:MAG: Thiol:disulfide interchange protein DsbA [Steroidobacteraceae bacterium]|nr:Thiol:disulfide interchange protein DsbA [Steroidobacteraceae bacterium]
MFANGAQAAEPAASPWVEGRHYALIEPAQPTQVPAGKVEVVEVFSYGCPACNQFEPIMLQLAARLPKNAQLVHVPASWNAAESWPLFQRAYLTAQVLGIADKTHEAMYDAIWKTGELAVVDPVTHRLKEPQPTIGLVARFYARVGGVTQQAVLDTAKSFAVDVKMMEADELVKAYGVEGTPTLIVAGKYRVNNSSVRSADELIELVLYLVKRG